MRRGLFFSFIVGFLLLTGIRVYADPIPDEVLRPYQASKTEMQNKNINAAAKHAKIAWEKAEELLGDSETTGNLAYNYGLLALNQKQNKSAAIAIERSADLIVVTDKKTGLRRLRREETLAVLLIALDKRDQAKKPINIKVVHSWPKKIFEKSSMRAVRQWRYTPRIAEETDEQRKDLRTTITYILTGYYGGDPI